MGDYIEGWRRKMGCVTLLTACVFMIGWIRSTVTSDYIRFFPVQFHGILIVSRKQEISLQTWSGKITEEEKSKPRKKSNRKKRVYQPERFGIHLNEELTRREPFGSSVMTVFQPEAGQFERHHSYDIPYWSISIPLTLVSAFLLLPKSPKSTPKKISEPTAIEGA